MDRIINEITLDFTQNISLASVNIKQGDDGGRLIRVYLKNNGTSVPVSTANGDTATLYASVNGMITADGTAAIINDTTNTVDILITSTLSAAAGREHCEIRITSGTGKIHTARFTILVGAASASADMPEVIKTADILDYITEMGTQLQATKKRVTKLEQDRAITASTFTDAMRAMMPECYTARKAIPVEDFTQAAGGGYEYTFERPIGSCDFDPKTDKFMMWVVLEDGRWLIIEPNSKNSDRRIVSGDTVSFGVWLKFYVTQTEIKVWVQTITNTHVQYVFFFTHEEV